MSEQTHVRTEGVFGPTVAAPADEGPEAQSKGLVQCSVPFS